MDSRVYDLACDLFAAKVAAGACNQVTAAAVAAECLDQAAAFVATADTRQN